MQQTVEIVIAYTWIHMVEWAGVKYTAENITNQSMFFQRVNEQEEIGRLVDLLYIDFQKAFK